jgi:haloalkane dehalogenase
VDYGSLRRLTKNERHAYDAPFPGERYKIAPRSMPGKVPLKFKNHEAIKNRQALERLGKFNKPFLTVFGDSDPVTKGWDRILQMNIPGARDQQHRILKAGHFIQEDAPDELAEIIITFINKSIL